MLNKSLLAILITFLLPVGVLASTVDETDTAEAFVEFEEISIVDWAKENSEMDFEIQEDVSGEVVIFRLALEVLDLESNTEELGDIRESDSWISSLRAAWAQHKISVQLRRIDLLLKSAIKQEVITEELEEVFSDYILVIKQGIRD